MQCMCQFGIDKCPSQIFISTDFIDISNGTCSLGSIMKTTIKLIRNILEKFYLIANPCQAEI